MSLRVEEKLTKIYKKLFDEFGPQDWWPGDTSFEVIVGAILTQNTNWGNVEKALLNLKSANILSPSGINDVSSKKLASLIKPSGFFNIKTKRLKNFIKFLFDEYGGKLSNMKKGTLPVLRKKILSVNGIGPETADSMLLYAFQKPIFVVDAYTKRIFFRHGMVKKEDSYSIIQNFFMKNLKHDMQMFNEYHAMIVCLAKKFCKVKPSCEGCPLSSMKHVA